MGAATLHPLKFRSWNLFLAFPLQTQERRCAGCSSMSAPLFDTGGFSFGFVVDDVTDRGSDVCDDRSGEPAAKRARTGQTEVAEVVAGVVKYNPPTTPDGSRVPDGSSWGEATLAFECEGARVPVGTVCRINWEKSSQFSLWVHAEAHAEPIAFGAEVGPLAAVEGFAPVQAIKPFFECHPSAACPGRTHSVWRSEPNDTLLFLDSVYQPPTAITASPHFCSTPLDLEPGLESFCWPLRAQEFLNNVYQQRSLVVLGSGQRLAQLAPSLLDLDLAALLEGASKITVWMKTLGGQMQYLSAPPDIALNCYAAGHSLYFNPSMEIQKKYIKALCNDLRLDFGLSLDGGFGGDLEIFAVVGSHDTPWHFDAQENFTIQLKGTKRWSLCPSGIADPMTNFNPLSTNLEVKQNDYKVHRGYTGKPLKLEDEERAETFVLRPGSVMYAPAGTWHRVVAGEEGSLSLNFSVDGPRWSELLLARLGPLLHRTLAGRRRVHVADEALACAEMEEVLGALREGLGRIRAEDVLPPSIFLSNREATVDVLSSDQNQDLAMDIHTLFRLNPLAVLVPTLSTAKSSSPSQSSSTSSYTIHHGWGRPGFTSDHSVEICVGSDELLIRGIDWLRREATRKHPKSILRGPGHDDPDSYPRAPPISVSKLCQRLSPGKVVDFEKAGVVKLFRLVRVLAYNGFLTPVVNP